MAIPHAAGATIPLPENPDAGLMHLCASRKEMDALTTAGLDMTSDDLGHDAMWSRLCVLRTETRQIARTVAEMQAHTQADIRARAAAVNAMKPADCGIGDSVSIDWHQGTLDALLFDLTGRV